MTYLEYLQELREDSEAPGFVVGWLAAFISFMFVVWTVMSVASGDYSFLLSALVLVATLVAGGVVAIFSGTFVYWLIAMRGEED